MMDDSSSCCFWFLQTKEVGTGGGAGQEMAGSGEGKSLAEEVISSHDSSEFTTCRKGIKNRDNSSDVLPHWFPVGGRDTLHMVTALFLRPLPTSKFGEIKFVLFLGRNIYDSLLGPIDLGVTESWDGYLCI
jgi:hypothetical protein